MDIGAGFDMDPPLSKEVVDRQIRGREHPKLPFEGHKFVRFSPKVSGAIASRSGVKCYINTVTRVARAHFGSRVQCWNEGADQYGVHDWKKVHESIRSYEQLGIVARFSISKGTQIICEKPFLITVLMPPDKLESFLAKKLKAMSKASQRQFFSLHNNFHGNAKKHKTIYAIRSIERGAEITISYDHGGASRERQVFLKDPFGFRCVFLEQELDGCASAMIARLYYDAFHIIIAHGDQARASMFAERAYKARVICEGEDSPETLRVKSLAVKPADHN
ncbi:hypothetical protein M441DRAFT_74731 [Trichoderma asperellum CBS 433.97]|uniref:SET domain-containing protein n=1 Tax=Trichoderma asperellum (strain ATCC 204424 / CBS 433.97 / NBRC 101777) TaxID=1042311 RepID=A0A2T3YQT2_TRIA4|nr:hypothetical protein M441DRAFT_74731 [Trichoderma asperellum CBS 433.97]PTB34877.1 hypothetical protein M441DRAFT_74731 [Trichoderma asperellum CBS 433.97]